MKVTPGQIKRIHSLLPKRIKDDPQLKAELVQAFTKDASRTSTKDLSMMEAQGMIGHLKHSDSADKMRKKILSICHEMQWYQHGTTKLDWNRITRFLTKYGHAHKAHLNDYSILELPKLVTQFESLLKTYYQTNAG